MNPQNQPSQLVVPEPSGTQMPEPSTGALLAAVITQGVTPATVEVVERLCAMRREEAAIANKAFFNCAFFALKKDIAKMEFYADKAAKTDTGKVAYTYCSESEISEKLEPVLFRHGFAMLFGQRQDGERITADITLIHESGHEEKREYTVTRGKANRMKDETSVDASATTSAWRHLVIKLFGLKSRIREEGDARNIGGKISAEKASELRDRCEAIGGNTVRRVLAFAMTESFEDIGEAIVPLVENLIVGFEKSAKKPDAGLAKEELFK